MNVKDVALVPPDDSTMQVVVKASINIQFATLAASIFAGRNHPGIPFSSVEELLDSLEDLTMNHTPATAATRLGSKQQGAGLHQVLLVVAVCSVSREKVETRRCMALEI